VNLGSKERRVGIFYFTRN